MATARDSTQCTEVTNGTESLRQVAQEDPHVRATVHSTSKSQEAGSSVATSENSLIVMSRASRSTCTPCRASSWRPPVDLEGRHHWRNLLLGAEHRRATAVTCSVVSVGTAVGRLPHPARPASPSPRQTNRADVALHLTLAKRRSLVERRRRAPAVPSPSGPGPRDRPGSPGEPSNLATTSWLVSPAPCRRVAGLRRRHVLAANNLLDRRT